MPRPPRPAPATTPTKPRPRFGPAVVVGKDGVPRIVTVTRKK